MAHIQRIATIVPLTSYSADSGTITEDIDIKQPITELTVGFQATNHGTAPNVDANIARTITKISLVDGSDVLWGLSGPMAVAEACYENGKMPRRLDREDASVASRIRIPIRFGNFLGDEKLAFDASKFVNPQIRVEYNLAAIAAVGANSYATGTMYLAIYARVMEGAARPEAWIMAKELESWTTAASGYKYVDLPVDYPHRHLLARGFYTKVGLNSIWNEVKLSKNVDAFVFYDVEMAEIQRQIQSLYPALHQNRVLYCTHGDTLNCYFGDHAKHIVQVMAGNYNAMVNYAEGTSILVYMYNANAGTAETSDRALNLHSVGWCPENTVLLPMANPGDKEHWVAFESADKVRVRFKEATASGTGTVATVQLRSY